MNAQMEIGYGRGNAQEILEIVMQGMNMIKVCFKHAQKHLNEVHYIIQLITP